MLLWSTQSHCIVKCLYSLITQCLQTFLLRQKNLAFSHAILGMLVWNFGHCLCPLPVLQLQGLIDTQLSLTFKDTPYSMQFQQNNLNSAVVKAWYPQLFLQVMRTGTNQRPLTPGQGQQSQQESLAAAAAANPALAYTGMPGKYISITKNAA